MKISMSSHEFHILEPAFHPFRDLNLLGQIPWKPYGARVRCKRSVLDPNLSLDIPSKRDVPVLVGEGVKKTKIASACRKLQLKY